jgi:Lon protease-like protein
MSDDFTASANFHGRTRLFPLPNLVLFPHAVQPLHIFEPRYRQMTADALAGDQLIALVLLQPNWEEDYDSRPGIHSVACLGKIVADQRLEDGRYNLLLRGHSRVRILHEVLDSKLYRSAEVELLVDIDVTGKHQKTLRKQLVTALTAWFPTQEGVYAQLGQVLQSGLPLGALVDVLTFALPLTPDVKQRQLEELDVERRIACLLANLPAKPAKNAPDHKFPPDFSLN